MDDRPFPMQLPRDHEGLPRSIPWWIADRAYREYSRRFGTEQTLERLAERGGFGWVELGWFLAEDLLRHNLPLLERCEEALLDLDPQWHEALGWIGLLADLRRELRGEVAPVRPCPGSGTVVSALFAGKECPACGGMFMQKAAGPAVGINLWAIPEHLPARGEG